MSINRREFLATTGLGALAFQVAGVAVLLSPRQARAQGVALRSLSEGQSALIDALGETLLPGAAGAGLSHYLDQQLSCPAPESLLMIRYLDVPPPYADFYLSCLAALDALSQKSYARGFASLAPEKREEIVRDLQKGAPNGWRGPPAGLFYFVLRADAIDVVYGTVEGFAKLNVPYMPHIVPPSNW